MRIAPRRHAAVSALLLVVLAGLALHALHTTTGAGGPGVDPLFNDWVYNVAAAGSALACLLRGILVRAERAAWLAIGIGLCSWSIGELYWTVALSDRDTVPYPSLADGFYLATYPALYAGVVLLVRSRLSRFFASLWLDGVIGALAIAALGAALLYPAFETAGAGDPAAVATTLAYPLADLLLLSIVVAALGLTGWRPGAGWIFLAAGLATNAVADGYFLYREATSGYAEGTPVDSIWLAGGFLIAYAAWCEQTRPNQVRLEGLRLLVVPSCFALAAIGIELYGQFAELNRVAEALATGTFVAVILRMALTFDENLRLLGAFRREALTDPLTSLGNRRRLLLDLSLATDPGAEPHLFGFFDLDGFKGYNDSFGHPAGDALLQRLSQNLSTAMQPHGKAYRLGGDEFCVLVPLRGRRPNSISAAASAGLTEEGEAFTVGNSRGVVMLPQEAGDPASALRLADRRLYAQKARLPRSPERQTRNVLLRVLREREPQLGEHLEGVARLAVALGQALDLPVEELDVVARAAELHDVGKMAVPDQVLRKPGPLNDVEWAMIRKHTLTGERILAAAPAMVPVGKVVRSSHERWDGGGYPDGLGGEEIPLGSRIIAICDAYEAMIEERPWRAPKGPEQALAELARCAGGQFDPRLVEAFSEHVYPQFAQRPRASEASEAVVRTGERSAD